MSLFFFRQLHNKCNPGIPAAYNSQTSIIPISSSFMIRISLLIRILLYIPLYRSCIRSIVAHSIYTHTVCIIIAAHSFITFEMDIIYVVINNLRQGRYVILGKRFYQEETDVNVKKLVYDNKSFRRHLDIERLTLFIGHTMNWVLFVIYELFFYFSWWGEYKKLWKLLIGGDPLYMHRASWLNIRKCGTALSRKPEVDFKRILAYIIIITWWRAHLTLFLQFAKCCV